MNVSTMAARVPVISGIIYVTEELNRQLEAWAYTYNYVRPLETYRRWKKIQKSQVLRMLGPHSEPRTFTSQVVH